jgi:hypothetical protein
MIIKPMAITRCPYCHAIIDENDKYCNNCGTQLLFTEDEEIEEEIPGEKIIDAEVEDKDYTVNEPEDEKRPSEAKDLDAEIDEELEKELREETEEMALDELVAEEAGEEAADAVTEEVILIDEIAVSEAKDKEGSRESEDKSVSEPKKDEEEGEEDEDEDAEDEENEEDENKDEAEESDKEKDEEKDGDEDIEDEDIAPAPAKEPAAVTPGEGTTEIPEPLGASEEIAEVEYVTEPADVDFASTAGESALKPVTFDTRELEDIGKTVDLGQAQVDRFMEARAVSEPAPASPPAQPQAEEKPASGEPPTGTLPPWASTMKGAPVFPADTGPVETRKIRGGEPAGTDAEEEVEIFPRRKASDSTMGLPERVSQSPLPFGRPADEEEIGEAGEEEEEVAAETDEEAAEPVRPAREPILPRRGAEGAEEIRREIEPLDESDEAGPRPAFSFSVFFKSKVFDVLFVGLFWLVALGLAAASMGLTFFEILGSMSGSMLLLYGVLVFLYFFLFKFFLGETLGDRLFRPRE